MLSKIRCLSSSDSDGEKQNLIQHDYDHGNGHVPDLLRLGHFYQPISGETPGCHALTQRGTQSTGYVSRKSRIKSAYVYFDFHGIAELESNGDSQYAPLCWASFLAAHNRILSDAWSELASHTQRIVRTFV